MKNYLRLATLSLALLGANAHAALIVSGVSIPNDSSAEEALDAPAVNRPREFHTQSSIGPVDMLGDSTSFTSHMQWYNGMQSNAGVAQVHKRNIIYDLFFTVEDPLNLGYEVGILSLLQGYSTSEYYGTDVSGDGGSQAVIATSSGLSGRIDTNASDGTDTLDAQIADLTIIGGVGATSNVSSTSSHVFNTANRNYNAGIFSGTRSFALRFTSVFTPTTNVIMQNNVSGEGSVRYGINATLASLQETGLQMTNDQYSNSDLGHFVSVAVEAQSSVPPGQVPVPGTLALFGLGLGLLRLLRRS